MNFIIGDIHGEINKLKDLIKNILNKDENPTLIFVGDYLNKGLYSIKVLDFLNQIKAQYNCVFLIGNHEYMWLNPSQYEERLHKYGGSTLLQNINIKTISEASLFLKEKYSEFFSLLKPYYIHENYFICHGGISDENKNTHFTQLKTKDFIFNRYNLDTDKFFYMSHYKVIFGHTSFDHPYVDEFKIGIDTGACYYKKQPLTSYCIEEKTFLNSLNQISSIEDYTKVPNIIRK